MPDRIVDKPLSRKEEQQLLRAARRLLLDGGFPNAERVGCPGSEILRAIALRKMDLTEVDDWLDHLGCCSPCFVEYSAFRKQAVRSARLRLMAIAASVLVIIGVGTWLLVNSRHPKVPESIASHNQPPAIEYERATLDLTNRSILRGEEGTPKAEPLLELRRSRLAVTIYLPLGSEEGRYQVQILQRDRHPVATAEGVAQIRNGKTVLEVKLDLSSATAGQYTLAIRRDAWDWQYYKMALR